MKIMTYNIQHCEHFERGEIDFDAVADVIKNEAPHVVGLNEVRGAGQSPDYKAQAAILAAKTGMNCREREPLLGKGI